MSKVAVEAVNPTSLPSQTRRCRLHGIGVFVHTMRGGKITHGKTGTRTFRCWIKMRERCYKPSSESDARLYRDKGVTVCDRWRHSFTEFLNDMGECPAGHSIDRIDPKRNYEPGNCRWATPIIQGRNTSRVRLSDAKVQLIWDCRAKGVKRRVIAEMVGASVHCVDDVIYGRRWKPGEVTLPA